MSNGATFRCESCENVVEDVPMRIAKCVQCGGDMTLATEVENDELVDVDDVMAGDWIVSEYDLDARPRLCVGVDRDRERIWIVDPAWREKTSSPEPSYLNRNGVRAHVRRGAELPGPIEADVKPSAPPTAPPELPKYLREGADKQSASELRSLARYAERLAAWKETEADRELADRSDRDVEDVPDEWDGDEWDDAIEKARDKADISARKGSLTTKHIDGRDYYYLQWREGDKIKSQYVAPVVPARD